MDIRPSRPAAAADTKTTTQTQKNPSDSSLLSRMAVRTMLEDLEVAKNKGESTDLSTKIVTIPVPLPPASLISSAKTVSLVPPPPPESKPFKIEPPIPPETKLNEEIKDELTRTIEDAVAQGAPKKTTEESIVQKEIEKKLKEGSILEMEEVKQKTKEEEQKVREEERKKREAEALKIKEEKQKTKEEQKAALQATREEEKKKREEDRITKELAEKTAQELKLAKEIEEREAAKKLKTEIDQNLEKIELDSEAEDYESVIDLAQKTLAYESISWFLKFRLNRLIKKAASAIRKRQINQIRKAAQIKDEESIKKIIASLPSPMTLTTAQKIIVSPPPNLPTLPDSPEELQILPSQIPSLDKLAPKAHSISPLLTELISESPSEGEDESGFNFLDFIKNKRVLLIGASFALVIILVGFGVWFANKDAGIPVVVSPSATPTFSATPMPSRPAPEPLFATDKQKTITLGSNGITLRESLLTLAKTEEPVGTFTALNVKDDAGKFLSLKEIAQDMNLEIFSMPTQGCDQIEENCTEPKTIEELLDLTNFSLFVYSQNSSSTNSFSPFSTASSTNEGRLGLIISLKKQTNSTSTQSIESQLINSLKDLETLLPREFASFLLKNSVIPQISAFSQTSYKDTDVRYLNLPTSSLSVDYAILDNKLIFATSKESMFAIIEQIAPANQTGGNF